jgi:hypothetical protein
MRGNSGCDVFIATTVDELWHYNGRSWKVNRVGFGYPGGYSSLAVRGDIVAGVGFLASEWPWRALAVIGKRK